MKIVVTGASGFIGQQIVPLLEKSGIELLLVGRDRKKLANIFPGREVCHYETLERDAAGFDLLVHLAVANNDNSVSKEEFESVNVDFLMDVCELAKKAKIKRFVNVSTMHALEENKSSDYALSKRKVLAKLADVEGIETVSVFLPLVYGDRWAGKLRVLNRLPKWMASPLFSVLASLKPTVQVNRLVHFLNNDVTAMADKGEVIISNQQDGNIVYFSVKRLIDLLFVVSVTVFFGWGLLLVWFAVKFGSAGPGIFAQRRVGRGGRAFTCYKFRTMKTGTTQAGTHEVSAQSVTAVGRFLRKTKIDELPQIWNILRNDLSLVGPRPSLPVQQDVIDARKKRGALDVKPGISGLAQINGIDMSDPERLAYWDRRYLDQRSLLLDLKIIIATFTGSGQGDRTRVN